MKLARCQRWTRTGNPSSWISGLLGCTALALGLFCLVVVKAPVVSPPSNLGSLAVAAFFMGSVVGIAGLALGISVAKEEPQRIGAHLGIWCAILGGVAAATAVVSIVLMWVNAWGV